MISRYTPVAVTLAAAMTAPVALATTPSGCYKPVYGYAASICTDANCTTQSGYYRIVLRNPQLPLFKQRLVLRGTFSGHIHGSAACANGSPYGVAIDHVLVDNNHGETIQTKDDVGCPIDPNDNTPPVKVIETLNIVDGSGIYQGATGQVTLTGTLAGFNTFAVTPTPDDIVCLAN